MSQLKQRVRIHSSAAFSFSLGPLWIGCCPPSLARTPSLLTQSAASRSSLLETPHGHAQESGLTNDLDNPQLGQ